MPKLMLAHYFTNKHKNKPLSSVQIPRIIRKKHT